MSGKERARVKFIDALQGRAGLCVRCNDNRAGFCGECMEKQSDYRVAAAKATITEAVCKEAYERGVAEERERIELCIDGEVHDPNVRQDLLASIRNPSPACETAGEEE